MAITYATFNPSDKSSHITLSNGNLSAQSDASGWCSVRSTIGVSSGKWYWELTVASIGGSGAFHSIANSSAAIETSYLGQDINGWGYHAASGDFFNNGDKGTPAVTWTSGDVIGIALDMDAGTVKFYKNNTLVSGAAAFTGLTGTIYAGTSLIQGSPTLATANFGATTMAYTAPSGYNQGLYTGSASVNSGFFMMMK